MGWERYSNVGCGERELEGWKMKGGSEWKGEERRG